MRSIIICPDEQLAHSLEKSLADFPDVSLGRTLHGYPSGIELSRTMRTHAPELVFLSFESVEKAQELIKLLQAEILGVQVIAIDRNCDAHLLRESMRAGVREFLSEPFEMASVREALVHVKELLEVRPAAYGASNHLFCFLPSKAGVGTSTIALNVAAALARQPGNRTLLSDFDLNSGMMRFLLKLKNESSVVDAVERSNQLDENLWPQLVTQFENLDVLHSGRVNPNLRIEAVQIRHLISFMRRSYDALVFDLSGNLEKYSVEIMHECTRILLVCTAEVSSLHLARERMHFLRSFNLEGKVSVLLNRCDKKALLKKTEIEELLELPVIQMFPNDYQGVNAAIAAGTWIDPNAKMGKLFSEFADSLMNAKAQPEERRHKFLEFFSTGPRALTPVSE